MSLNSVQSFVIENCNGPTIENGLNNVCLHPLSRTCTCILYAKSEYATIFPNFMFLLFLLFVFNFILPFYVFVTIYPSYCNLLNFIHKFLWRFVDTFDFAFCS